MMTITHTARLTGLVASALIVTGCASVGSVKPGTTYNSLIEQYGTPAVICPASDGTTRLVWSEGNAGEQAYAVTVDNQQRVSSVTQLMQQPAFDVLKQGQWNTHDVRCQFGLPALVRSYGDTKSDMVWQYRFYGPGGEYDMLFVTFDRASGQMVSFSTGPDPELNLTMLGGGR
ncbi:MAG TPA: hypothetical protein VIC30_05025 [Orrella sp.]